MTDMVEKVARAIAEHSRDQDWTLWVEEARAAIASMREPSEEMIAHAWRTVSKEKAKAGIAQLGPGPATREVWARMIDAALEGKG